MLLSILFFKNNKVQITLNFMASTGAVSIVSSVIVEVITLPIEVYNVRISDLM